MSIYRLSRIFYLASGVLLSLLAVFAVLRFRGQRELTRTQDIRYASYLLADELRQSSDDLTRMARTYVITNRHAGRNRGQDAKQPADGRDVATISISSTFEDLKHCRHAVYDRQCTMRHAVIAREDSVASDQNCPQVPATLLLWNVPSNTDDEACWWEGKPG
jgi:hypothetical protein